MSGDVGAEVAAVLERLLPLDFERHESQTIKDAARRDRAVLAGRLAAALAPFIAERVEAAKAEWPAAAFIHDDHGVCLYNAASGTWYANDDGVTLHSPRPICEREHGEAAAVKLTDAEHNEYGELAGRIHWDRTVYTEEAVERIIAERVEAVDAKHRDIFERWQAAEYEAHHEACKERYETLRQKWQAAEAELREERERVEAARAEAVELAAVAPKFWQRVTVGSPAECWPWTGPTVGYGHGHYRTPAGRTAHRYAWAAANGRFPGRDEIVRHRCDNPPCCNPAHLEIGTQQQNVDDMIDRGRATFTRTSCRAGHDRTPENTVMHADGSNRCKTCVREAQAERRAALPTIACPRCGRDGTIYNIQRHLKRLHDETWTPDQLRALDPEARHDGGRG